MQSLPASASGSAAKHIKCATVRGTPAVILHSLCASARCMIHSSAIVSASAHLNPCRCRKAVGTPASSILHSSLSTGAAVAVASVVALLSVAGCRRMLWLLTETTPAAVHCSAVTSCSRVMLESTFLHDRARQLCSVICQTAESGSAISFTQWSRVRLLS